jgi:N-acetyldiaminopimelate deacetylase
MLDLIKIRKDLHRIPELAFEEFKTKEYLMKVLKMLKDIKIHTFDFPGILVEYSHGKGEYTLFRSDMDSLPITEETGCDFASKHTGKMHACGHDMHMTILLGLIEKVVNEKIEQNILFLFQPAEEGKGGAKRILNTGILDKFPIKKAYALHVKGDIPVGTVSTKPGIFFANTEEVDIVFTGIGAHVALADKGKDALDAGFKFYRLVNEKIKEEFNNSKEILCKFGKMSAGNVRNAIAANCKLEGTIRAFSIEDHELLKEIVKKSVQEISGKFNINGKCEYSNYYKALINDKKLYKKFVNEINDSKYTFQEADRLIGGEDFGFFADKYTGLFFWLGADQGDRTDLHSSKFLPDERAIAIGIKIFWSLIK